MAITLYQIKIELKNSKPKIWRKILIKSDMFLSDFHMAIQFAMGWTNSHMHSFEYNGKSYSERVIGDDFWDEFDCVDYKNFKVSKFLKNEKDKIKYEYDFGDGWEHNIVLEKILPIENDKRYPICIGGKNSCPPEDCGGIYYYIHMLEVLKNPKHKEYKEIKDWLEEEFDPEEFDLQEVNSGLASFHFY
jgi:hypothetical protein